MTFTQSSVVEIPEGALVDLFLGESFLRRILLAPFIGTDTANVCTRVPGNRLCPGGSPVIGDVDMLLVGNPDGCESTAIEFKRIKIGRDTFATGSPNKLGEVVKATHQANILQIIGFARVFLAFLVVIDARDNTQVAFPFRGATPQLLHVLDEALDIEDLHRDVGLVRFEIVQPVDKPITWAGAIPTKIHRAATSQKQPDKLSANIRAFMESPSNN